MWSYPSHHHYNYSALLTIPHVGATTRPPSFKMATSIPPNPTSHTVVQLLGKLNDTDPDFRFMALNDLIAVFANAKNDMLYHDYNTAARTIDYVVKALDDQNGEVQNQAIKWSVSPSPFYLALYPPPLFALPVANTVTM